MVYANRPKQGICVMKKDKNKYNENMIEELL